MIDNSSNNGARARIIFSMREHLRIAILREKNIRFELSTVRAFNDISTILHGKISCFVPRSVFSRCYDWKVELELVIVFDNLLEQIARRD